MNLLNLVYNNYVQYLNKENLSADEYKQLKLLFCYANCFQLLKCTSKKK